LSSLERRYRSPSLTVRGKRFSWGERTYVMAIINATPDSFSGDGTGGDPGLAAVLARQFESEGADIIDLGGESTRPGAAPVSAAEEARRVLPAVEVARRVTDLPISIDTAHASVAEQALEAGADIVNDINGLRGDPAMAGVVASAGAPAILMHNQRGRPFHDVAGDIICGFRESLRLACQAGIDESRLILDPGFGFGWTPGQNLEMLRRLPELWDLGLPLVLGTSRKSTIGEVLGTPVHDRLEGTAATVALAIAGGADIIRVHDVKAMARVARMADAVVRGHWTAL
jgi:dihydropteroate synthase